MQLKKTWYFYWYTIYIIIIHCLVLYFWIKFYIGTPTSLFSSLQKWDYPNAWPPLQAFIIQGLDRTQQKHAQQVAVKLADVWLHSNYKGFTTQSAMFEKVGIIINCIIIGIIIIIALFLFSTMFQQKEKLTWVVNILHS